MKKVLLRVMPLAGIVLGCSSVFAQNSPAPRALQQPNQTLQSVPSAPLQAPTVTLSSDRAPLPQSAVKLNARSFNVKGVTVFKTPDLQKRLASLTGRQIGSSELQEVLDRIRQRYASAGYLLTDVYFPRQSFSATGGVVDVEVVEARVGAVRVEMADDVPVNGNYVNNLFDHYLKPGMLITERRLDAPLLVLRDVPGITAAATIVPGASPGTSDVVVKVSARGRKWKAIVGADNFGTPTVGEYRVSATGSVDNLLQRGDTLLASVQAASQSGTLLYRLSYKVGLGTAGGELGLSLMRSEYVLGGDFAALGASGTADVLSLNWTQPLLRSRSSNLYVQVGADAKRLTDNLGVTGLMPQRDVITGHLSLVGNTSDAGLLAGGVTRYGAQLTYGSLSIKDASSLAADQSLFGGRTNGSFFKGNLDLQRIEFLSSRSSVLFTLSSQFASHNLTSAEKLGLTGATAVRGLRGDAASVVDEGVVGSLEYRYLMPFMPADSSLQARVFYDYGIGILDKRRDATTYAPLVNEPNQVSFDSLGLGFSAALRDRFNAAFWAAKPLREPAIRSEGDSAARVWFSLQYSY